MTDQPENASTLQARQVYLLAAICLIVGLAIGYILRGTQPQAAAALIPSTKPLGMPPGHGAMPTPEQMKQMADKKAGPLLEKLKADPNNSALLLQVGAIYHGTRQFSQAATYYDRAVQTDPKNAAYRVKLASSLYRSGNPDAAIMQLDRALTNDPGNANALFDLGMVKLTGKQDRNGAVDAWHQLLKSNPQLPLDKKAVVEKLIAGAQAPALARRSTQP